jgi:hypothetical protein
MLQVDFHFLCTGSKLRPAVQQWLEAHQSALNITITRMDLKQSSFTAAGEYEERRRVTVTAGLEANIARLLMEKGAAHDSPTTTLLCAPVREYLYPLSKLKAMNRAVILADYGGCSDCMLQYVSYYLILDHAGEGIKVCLGSRFVASSASRRLRHDALFPIS